jgi:hypothetical protein
MGNIQLEVSHAGPRLVGRRVSRRELELPLQVVAGCARVGEELSGWFGVTDIVRVTIRMPVVDDCLCGMSAGVVVGVRVIAVWQVDHLPECTRDNQEEQG